MKLLNLEDISSLDIDDVHDLYSKYVNKSQVNLISKFGFGNDIAVKAEGCFIYTKNKKQIYDFTGGIGVLNHGHNHSRILKARENFAKNKKMEVHKNFFSPYVAGLSHNIASLLSNDLKISYFSNSGADANEGALKLAYKYHKGKRDYALFSDISFHGKKVGAGNVTGSKETSYFRFQQILKTKKFIYNDLESVKHLVEDLRKNNTSNIYAIIVEPFSASSLLSCSESFLRGLRDICSKENIVLIYDEVYSGWCKTGNLFYFMNFNNAEPDILTSGKSLGGGKASISAYTCKEKFFKKSYDNLRDATLHSTTFNALGEETITAIEAINILIEDDYVKKSKQIFDIINPGLIELKKKYPSIIKDVRGSGSLNGIVINTDFTDKYFLPLIKLIPSEFTKDDYAFKKVIVSSIISELYDKHNILTFYGSNIDLPLKISAPIITEKEHINYFLRSLDKTLSIGLIKLVTNFVKKIF
jgi:putrescine aminotransferase